MELDLCVIDVGFENVEFFSLEIINISKMFKI